MSAAYPVSLMSGRRWIDAALHRCQTDRKRGAKFMTQDLDPKLASVCTETLTRELKLAALGAKGILNRRHPQI